MTNEELKAKTLPLIHPELAPMLPILKDMDLRDATLDDVRESMATLFNSMPAPETPNITKEEILIPGRDGAPRVRLLIYFPIKAKSSEPLPVILHMHGGGMVLGQASWFEGLNRQRADELGCVVISVDYRLAPETKFPGAVEDGYTALLWVHTNATKMGIDPNKIAVAGESAGGGLAAALAILARDRKQVPICFQHLIYPMLDDRTGTAADLNPGAITGAYMWTRENNRYGWASLLGHEPGRSAGVSPYAAPARETNFAGLPPAFIAVGSLDLFAGEDVLFAKNLSAAGVANELRVYPGAWHGFDMNPQTQLAKDFARDCFQALDRALNGKVNA